LSRPFDLKHRSTTSRFYKRNAVKSLRLTRSRALARARESVRNFSSSKVKSRFLSFETHFRTGNNLTKPTLNRSI